MTSSDGGLVVNLYNAGTATTRLKSGPVTVEQTTDYPLTGDVALTISPEKRGQKFPVRLRIPPGTSGYRVSLNGLPVPSREITEPASGYVVIDRAWNRKDIVILHMTLADRVVLGDHENEGKAALMHGPLVLALDSAENPGVQLQGIGLAADPAATPPVFAPSGDPRPGTIAFTFRGEVAGKGKSVLTLLPFADAGADGKSHFLVWIPLSAPERR